MSDLAIMCISLISFVSLECKHLKKDFIYQSASCLLTLRKVNMDTNCHLLVGLSLALLANLCLATSETENGINNNNLKDMQIMKVNLEVLTRTVQRLSRESEVLTHTVQRLSKESEVLTHTVQ